MNRTSSGTTPEPEAVGKESIIPAQAVFKGDLETPGSVRISGKVDGNVFSGGTVEIEGTVVGDVHGVIIVCAGTVRGNLKADRLVQLKSGCFVRGDIKTPSVIRSEGASHNGKIEY